MQKGGVIFSAEMSRVILILILMILALAGFIYSHLSYQEGYFQSNRDFLSTQCPGNYRAETPHQLGLKRPDFLQRMTSRRDYKQNALQILIKRGSLLRMRMEGCTWLKRKLDEHLRSKRR